MKQSHFRKILSLFSIVLLVVAPALQSAPSIIPRPPQIAASSYILMDAKTGEVIVEENADEALPPASLTKIMTAYIAEVEIDAGNINLTDEVHISEKAWRTGGSKMFVQVGSKVQVGDLLRGIIIQSGNDASVAMAEHIAGSEEAFADMMNQHAEALGMTNSFFMNASGLDTPEYFNTMSARDLAILARATIVNHPAHYGIYSEREFTYNDITQANRNTLLFRDRNVDGMKTGWTEAAGYCLVASAERNDMRLVAVVMGAASENARAVEAQKLMTYGFRYYETHRLYDANEVINTARVWSGKENEINLGITDAVDITIPRGQSEQLVASLTMDEQLTAPIEQGQVLGTVDIGLEGDSLYSGNVVAMAPVERAGIFKRLIDYLTLFFTNLFS